MTLSDVLHSTYSYINDLLTNPTVIFGLLALILVGLVSSGSTGSYSSSSLDSLFQSGTAGTAAETGSTSAFAGGWLLLLFLLLLFLLFRFQSQIWAFLAADHEVEVEVVLEDPGVPDLVNFPQVFNIPENDFVYPDAKAVCSAYGARLATYQEVEEAYQKGGEWCNYGWSEGQMALFPTQQSTYDQLQQIEGHENDCGRPGVNGGYIANPAVKFGVNCFGPKPKMTPTEEELMQTEPLYPKTQKDLAMEERVNYWRDRLSEILVSPFNKDTWSKL